MQIRRLSWAQLTKAGVPPLFVLRPHPGGFTPPNVGDEYPAPNPANKIEMKRARQMYEQGRRIGTRAELDLVLARMKPAPLPLPPAKAQKEKKHGSRSA